jgi:hypothetical protein
LLLEEKTFSEGLKTTDFAYDCGVSNLLLCFIFQEFANWHIVCFLEIARRKNMKNFQDLQAEIAERERITARALETAERENRRLRKIAAAKEQAMLAERERKRLRLAANRVEIELCRQAIQAKRIRLALAGESETDRRIRELERSNANLRSIANEVEPESPERSERGVKSVNPEIAYRDAYQRKLKRASAESYFTEQGNRQEYRRWWNEQAEH